jgi:hypothetical protein
VSALRELRLGVKIIQPDHLTASTLQAANYWINKTGSLSVWIKRG